MPSHRFPNPAIHSKRIGVQREELSAGMNRLLSVMGLGRGGEETGRLLDFLEVQVTGNFAAEEDFMVAHGYPGYNSHKTEHEGFMKDLSTLRKEYKNKGISTFLVLKIERWVSNWIAFHMGRTDKALENFSKAFFKGASAALCNKGLPNSREIGYYYPVKKRQSAMGKLKDDKRQHAREPFAKVVTFSVIGSFDGMKEFWPDPDRVGTVVDVSENGIGMVTDTLLEPGMLVKFNPGSMMEPCVVMWALDLGSKYKIGMKYI